MVQLGGQGLDRAECPLRVGLRLGDRKGEEDIKGVTGYTIQDLAWVSVGGSAVTKMCPPMGQPGRSWGST